MVTFDPYNFRITRLSARKTEQMKIFRGQKYGYIYSLHTKIRLTMLCLSYFELCSVVGCPCFVIMDFILAYTSDSAPLS